ncbi:MAG: hypothetical protein EOO76_00270 [Novosphingobium sp.]|nr:MAG: hypothetical protein EOO76_00270 [Novosphingobium sp.]
MSIKRIVMVKRKQGLTPDQFREGYENSHSRIAVELFGHLWLEYRRNYLTSGYSFEPGSGDGTGGPEEIGFDAVSEFVLRDAAALEEMGRIALANHDRIKEDEARWFEQTRCWLVGCETVVEDLHPAA